MKEYHVTFQYDMEQSSAKTATRRIERLMQEKGAEVVSKSDEYDGWMDLVFHHYTHYENMVKTCNDVLNTVKSLDTKVSVYVCEHTPGVILDPKDVKDTSKFDEFINKLSKEHGATSIEPDEKNPELIRVNFERSFQRHAFQTDYSAKAADFMKNGHDGVVISPEWEDKEVLRKNNYMEAKKGQRY